jgi:hypothetical protein
MWAFLRQPFRRCCKEGVSNGGKTGDKNYSIYSTPSLHRPCIDALSHHQPRQPSRPRIPGHRTEKILKNMLRFAAATKSDLDLNSITGC